MQATHYTTGQAVARPGMHATGGEELHEQLSWVTQVLRPNIIVSSRGIITSELPHGFCTTCSNLRPVSAAPRHVLLLVSTTYPMQDQCRRLQSHTPTANKCWTAQHSPTQWPCRIAET